MRSKGIGKQLLNFVLNGEESINEQNPRAVGFYEYMGVETYILDFHKNIYHKEIEVELLCFKRPEMKFDSLESLSQQMHEDAEFARRYAKEHGVKYEDLNLIVIHLGGGVSVGAHSQGKVVDVNNILDGEGAFSPERAGTVPVGDLVKMCYSGKYTEKEVYKKICGNGGLNAYLHTNDFRDMQKMAEEGDEYAALVRDAFFYQISKDAGAMAAVLNGKVDQIILTGGIAYAPVTRKMLEEKLGWIAPFTVYPGEDELLALAQGGLRVIRGEEAAKEY